jgi:hypothetical protein
MPAGRGSLDKVSDKVSDKGSKKMSKDLQGCSVSGL